VKCAVGFAAVARDYAVGIVTSGAEAGTPLARQWVKSQWWADFVQVIVHHAHWWILGMVIAAVALNIWQKHRNLPTVEPTPPASER